MARYAIEMNDTASTSTALGAIVADATRPRRSKIYDLILSSEATPADSVFYWKFQRSTTAPTATAVTPQPLDPADAATETDCYENSTGDGTLTANAILLSIAHNLRATFRWVAAPGGELVIPATASNGIHYTFVSPTPSAVATATTHFEEQ